MTTWLNMTSNSKPKPLANPSRTRKVQELRRSNAAGPIANKKRYVRKPKNQKAANE